MNPNLKTVLALSYRANDIQAASARRRLDLVAAETADRPDATLAPSEPGAYRIFATVRRLLPRLA